MNRYFCGVPAGSCSGATMHTSAGLQHAVHKSHHTSTEAFKCHVRYLTSLGYTRVGSREFRPPDGGPITVLTKKSRFGGKLRQGKSGEKMTGSHRVMPVNKVLICSL